MLFSEPKIPQSPRVVWCSGTVRRFSALQRAENSSMPATREYVASFARVSVLFSEPKIPQFCAQRDGGGTGACFSALQRAENSSMFTGDGDAVDVESFSALQRAENSSIV